jgi:hypothetical protein
MFPSLIRRHGAEIYPSYCPRFLTRPPELTLQLDDVFFKYRNQLSKLGAPTRAPFLIPRSPMGQLELHTRHGSGVFIGVELPHVLVSKYVPVVFGPRGGS